MRQKTRKYEMNLCDGPLVPKILLFSVPVALSGILQQLFNTADTIIAGKCIGSTALAAVGSVGFVTSILVCLFMGIAMGVNVLVGQYFGASREKDIEETVHTSILVSLISGAFLTVMGIALARPLLILMDTPEDILDQAVTYMQIYFLGVTGMLVYNAGGAVLRSVGDTQRPLYILMAAGVANVAMNLLFVLVFRMDVSGLALATTLSQYLSAALVMLCLMRSQGSYRFSLKKLRLVRKKLLDIARVGIPSGVETMLFDMGNLVFQAALNSFGSDAIAGSVAASNVERYAYVIMNSFCQASLCFVSQNYGAGNYKRIIRSHWICTGFAAAVGFLLGNGAWLSGDTFLRLFSTDPEVLYYARIRMFMIGSTYFVCGMQEVFRGTLRGVNRSTEITVMSVFCILGVRLLWLLAVFPRFREFWMLWMCYPLSYLVLFLAMLFYYFRVKRTWPAEGRDIRYEI